MPFLRCAVQYLDLWTIEDSTYLFASAVANMLINVTNTPVAGTSHGTGAN
jgi:hypothetical protein